MGTPIDPGFVFNTTKEANAEAIRDIVRAIPPLALRAAFRDFIIDRYSHSDFATNLHTNNAGSFGPVVQVDANFYQFKADGTKPHVYIVLDVDVPPPNSTQLPHFGWEVKLGGLRKSNGHRWVKKGVPMTGRPPPGSTGLSTYTTPDQELTVAGERMLFQLSFQRYTA